VNFCSKGTPVAFLNSVPAKGSGRLPMGSLGYFCGFKFYILRFCGFWTCYNFLNLPYRIETQQENQLHPMKIAAPFTLLAFSLFIYFYSNGCGVNSIYTNKEVLPDSIQANTTIILIDTIVEELGRVQILLNKHSLQIKSWNQSDTIVGFFENTLGSDFNTLKVDHALVIGIVNGNSLAMTNIKYTHSGILFFAVRDQMYRPNIFAAGKDENKWSFICSNQQKICSVFYTTLGCQILDEPNNRLLVKYPGVDYDEKENQDFQFVEVIQYSAKEQKSIGQLKIKNLDKNYCDSSSIYQLYNSYLKISSLDYFDIYLNE
jgi:hypothetical protein